MNAKAKLMGGKENLVGSGNQEKGNLFYLDLIEISCFLAQVDDSWLWHKIMRHVNFNNVVTIRKNRRVRGIPNLKKLVIAI